MWFEVTTDWKTVDGVIRKAKHQQFAMDPGRTPLRVFLADPPDDGQPTIDLRPPCPLSAFPVPERF